jgi:Secretion system C-terminal sorting domain/PKD domain
MQMKKFKTLSIITPLTLAILLVYFFSKHDNPVAQKATLTQGIHEETSLAIPKSDPLSISSEKENFSKIKPRLKAKKFENAHNLVNSLEEREENEEEDLKGLSPSQRLSKQQRIKEALEHEFEITKDPVLGYVPIERKRQAINQTRRMQADMVAKSSFLRGSSIQKSRWIPRGPGNVGGRTRALMIDMGDVTRNTMFAGSSTGGLFKTTNLKSSGTKWNRINDYLDNLTISSLAQDPRNPKIMYFGTGDIDGNDANGNGIYKSDDGGNTWKILPSTFNSTFYTVASLMVTPDSGHIFAGTIAGLYKSKDGGQNWDKVLGSGFRFGSTDDKFYTLFRAKNGNIFACNSFRIFKTTQGGDLGTWKSITTGNGFPTNLTRAEMAVAPSNPDIIYAVGAIGSIGSDVYKTINGGDSWFALPKPSWSDGCGNVSTTDFTRGQAYYDLSLAVSPDDPNSVFLGGVDFFKSNSGGQTWQQLTDWSRCSGKQYAHADHHAAIFESDNSNYLYLGTDGGVFTIENPITAAPKSVEKTEGYITTQFYACAIHPDSSYNQFIAGAQDNGTLIVRSPGVGNVRGRSIGGDGFYCFIDQNEPKIQIGSIYYGDWHLSTDGGNSFSRAAKSNGGFVNPADYDSKTNILYAQTGEGDLWRWKLGSDKGKVIDVGSVTLSSISNVFVDENVSNRLYIGTRTGLVYRVDDAQSDAPKANLVGNFSGNISCVTTEKGDSNHLLVTLSSYGSKSVHESKNGGTTWLSIENNLPDMPIRWVVFNPNDNQQALIATDLGVWSTDKLDGVSTIWNPPFPGRGSPIVRTDMLKVRQSDKTILAGTYGRGMWTTNSFSKAAAAMDFNQVTYTDARTSFKGEISNAADSFLWNFGEGSTDTLENTTFSYKTIGTYKVSLKINGNSDLVAQNTIKVLPQVSLPYKKGTTNYDGSFEGTNEHFGTYSVLGSKFERANSTIFGKDGTHSGKNAYVLAPNDKFYQKNTLAYLYTPMYDMTEKGIYQFSFWSLFNIERAYDGMQVEFSLDKGANWQVLGANEPDWYTYKNTTLGDGAFPIGSNYFSVSIEEWTRFKLNITPLQGNKFVSFRFVFKGSDQEPLRPGVAIDDIEVTKYTGELKTLVINQGGEFAKTQTSIDVKFQTQPEYLAKAFQVEISGNGRNYSVVGSPPAKGKSSEELQDYGVKFEGSLFNFYYFRIKVLHEDTTLNFYTPPFVVKRDKATPLAINKIFPNPFTDNINVLFNDIVDEDVEMKLYDVAGRLIASKTVRLKNVYADFPMQGIAKGVYILSVKVGSSDPFTQKVFGGQ